MQRSKIKVSIVSNQLSTSQKEEMWDVYKKYYSYTKESFMKRIPKNNYFSLYSVEGKIVGFTGLRIQSFRFDGKKRFMMYFGQTVVEARYRGKSLIQKTGSKLCMKYFFSLLSSKAYFWCDALSYKPYLVFAKSLDEYYPSYKEETPADTQDLMNCLGAMNYGSSYKHKSGTIVKEKTLVADTSSKVRKQDLSDPDIRFYVQANQKLDQGHGLLTFAPANTRNLLRLLKRMVAVSLKPRSKKAPTFSKTPSIA